MQGRLLQPDPSTASAPSTPPCAPKRSCSRSLSKLQNAYAAHCFASPSSVERPARARRRCVLRPPGTDIVCHTPLQGTGHRNSLFRAPQTSPPPFPATRTLHEWHRRSSTGPFTATDRSSFTAAPSCVQLISNCPPLQTPQLALCLPRTAPPHRAGLGRACVRRHLGRAGFQVITSLASFPSIRAAAAGRDCHATRGRYAHRS